jgi:hypothetical protein
LVAIDAGEPCCQVLWESGKQMPESQKDRVGGKVEMERPEPLHIIVVDRPHHDRGTVAQRAHTSEVCG